MLGLEDTLLVNIVAVYQDCELVPTAAGLLFNSRRVGSQRRCVYSTSSLALPWMWVTSDLSCSSSEIIGLLHSTNRQRWSAGRTVLSGQNRYIPSVCVNTAIDISFVTEKRYRDPPARVPVPEGQMHSVF